MPAGASISGAWDTGRGCRWLLQGLPLVAAAGVCAIAALPAVQPGLPCSDGAADGLDRVIEPTGREPSLPSLVSNAVDPPGEVPLLLAQLGGRRMAVPSALVERILPMAELTRLPDPPPGVVGVLNVYGAGLPVVDPRPRFGLPTPAVHPNQYLILVAAPERYLLWVDGVEGLVAAAVEALPAAGAGHRHSVARLADEAVPLLGVADLLPSGVPAPLQETL